MWMRALPSNTHTAAASVRAASEWRGPPLILSRSRSLSLTHTHTLSISMSLYPSLSVSLFLSLYLARSHTPTLEQSLESADPADLFERHNAMETQMAGPAPISQNVFVD